MASSSPTPSKRTCWERAAASPRRGTCLTPGPVLVMNAKVVARPSAGDVDGRPRSCRRIATMLVRDDAEARRWGAIAVDATGRVVGILDARSPRPAEGLVTERMFTGVHVLERALVDTLRPVFSDVIRDAYIPALLAGETIRAEDLARLLRRALHARALSRGQPRPAPRPRPAGPPTGLPGRRRPFRRHPSAGPSSKVPSGSKRAPSWKRARRVGPLVVLGGRYPGGVRRSHHPGRGLARGDGGQPGRAGGRHAVGNGRDPRGSALVSAQRRRL